MLSYEPAWETVVLPTVCMDSRKATRSFIKCLLDMAFPAGQPIVDCT